jgi:hypothetical protein
VRLEQAYDKGSYAIPAALLLAIGENVATRLLMKVEAGLGLSFFVLVRLWGLTLAFKVFTGFGAGSERSMGFLIRPKASRSCAALFALFLCWIVRRLLCH